MKKFTILALMIMLFGLGMAQVPSGIQYQTVIRNSQGSIIAETPLVLKMSIHQGSPDGEILYSEIHPVTTNAFGLVNIIISNGTPQSGDYSAINWGLSPIFLEVALDLESTGDFIVMGVTQFLSVPYAQFAGNGIFSMSTAERDALENPSIGMQILNTTTNCLNYFNGYGWYETCGDCTPMPSPSNAGPDQYFSDVTVAVNLEGNTPEYGTGTWSVETGSGGFFEDVNNPNTLFTGEACQIYSLKWKITTSCGATEDWVQIEFDTPPSVANAGPDQSFNDETIATNLQANAPDIGSGSWSVETGAGGSFADVNDPTTLFTGSPCETYSLKWTITNPCGTSEDLVEIIFNTPPTTADAGADQTFNDATVSTNLEGNTPLLGIGTWSVETGTGGIFADVNDPTTLFTGEACENYNLKWMIANDCGEINDWVEIVFNTPPTPADAGSDQYFDDETISTMLEGNTPLLGVGTWSVETGTGGSFDDANNPTALFTGAPCETYTLKWTITNPCGSSEDLVDIIFNTPPTPADAGSDQYFDDETISTNLEGNTPLLGVGTWSVETGNGGTFDDVNDPTTLFTGEACETYNLKWMIANDCGEINDWVEIVFNTPPTPADAGSDQYFDDETISTMLEGNTPLLGLGTWSVETGNGGSFDDMNNPTTLFTGEACETYNLKWMIANNCGEINDWVEIVFNTPPTAADAGPDQLDIAGTSVSLSGNNPVSGSGVWSILSGTGGNISEPSNPTSIFSGTEGEIYELQWTISNNCGLSFDNVMISFAGGGGDWTCGESYTDPRDSQQYETVVIGDQCWMAENLNIGTLITVDQTDNSIIEKWCTSGFEENCDLYGAKYMWNEMMQYVTTEGTQGICPDGWYVATDDDWTILTDGLGGLGVAGGELKSTRTDPDPHPRWNSPNAGASNSSGFSALPAGVSQSASSVGSSNYLWTSSIGDQSGQRWARIMNSNNSSIARHDDYPSFGFSVRCIKSGFVPGNQAPETPSTPNPEDGAINQNIEGTTLSWTCTDSESDPLTYDIYFGTDNPPAQVATGQSETSYDPGTLQYSTQYFWKIVAHDDQGNSTDGAVWNFSTEMPSNQPPSQPSSPSPTDALTDQAVNSTLSWVCTDPDSDPLTYDVYFGTDNPPAQVATGQSETTYDPGTLLYSTQYFWKIVAHDDQGNSTEGAIWSFTTEEEAAAFACGDPFTDTRDGQSYETVIIGDQCWMAENLNIGIRIDGSSSPANISTIEKYCSNNDEANCDEYGGLYQWGEMMEYTTTEGTQGICPTGWHLPTDAEWCTLENYVDAGTISCSTEGFRGIDAGGNLKETGTSHWISNVGATNSSGFTGLPGGYRRSNGTFGNFMTRAFIWSSTENGTSAWMRYLDSYTAEVGRSFSEKTIGCSVRCLRDEEIINQPPSQPSSPSPADASTGQAVNSTFSWTCTDPESDPLTYDVYFGTDNPPAQVSTGQSETTYNPGTLEYSTEYFWKIVAHDDQGNSTEGAIWNFTTMDEPAPFACGEIITDSRDGNTYETVLIGGQCWMAKDLAYLPSVSPSGSGSLTSPHYYVYNYEGTDVIAAKATNNYQTYGVLYNWSAVMNGEESSNGVPSGVQGVCPTGWHVPSDEEWKILEGEADSQYGYPDPVWDGTMWRGSDVGGNLKEPGTTHWLAPNTGATNSSGFTSLPGGDRKAGGAWYNLGYIGFYWTSTESTGNDAWFRYLQYNEIQSLRSANYSKDFGLTVRCISNEVQENLSPEVPSSPNPEDGAANQTIEGTTLSWTCTDPESDPLTYDVYFGIENPPAQVATGQSETTYDPGTLEYSTEYFWKIVAHDDQGNSTEGVVWSFSVIEEPTTLVEVYNPATGRTWMDRNLGASQAATSRDDTAAYGDLYQWGRATEGHENRSSGWSNSNATTAEPKLGNPWDGLFIIEAYSPQNWLNTLDNTLWQGVNGTNNPCPTGFRLPIEDEWEAERLSWSSNDATGAFNSPLKLVVSGYRKNNNGIIALVGQSGQYSSSTVFSNYFKSLNFGFSSAAMSSQVRAVGLTVRCIKEETSNQAPSQPSSPSPDDASTGQTVNSILSWTCTDPEGDPLTYDVYFGMDNPPSQVATGQSETTYEPGTLEYSTQYFWKIVAHDDQGNSTEGTVWSFTTEDEPAPFTCGDIFTDSRDGNTYETVLIGDQCWMAENMAWLPSVSPSSEGSNTEALYYVNNYQGNNVTEAMATTNYQTYGALYNWPASSTACPEGWHLSSDDEWKILEGAADSQFPVGDPEWDNMEYRGFDVGLNLKTTSGWASNGNGSDLYGFSALPGGSRDYNGAFNISGNTGSLGQWWSSNESSTEEAWYRFIIYYEAKSYRQVYPKVAGFSVRCLKSGYTPQNLAPEAPSSPNPEDGAINQTIEGSTLSWSCTDPESDPLTYDVYFGTENPPAQVATGQSETTYDPGTLQYSTQYFWKIVAQDDQGNSTEGAIWSFTTEEEAATFACGDPYTDTRDGQSYETVIIGTQCWMAENLNIGSRIDGSSEQTDNSTIEKYCYDNDDLNCDVYGGFYQWNEMMEYNATSGTQGICPTGWHVPADDEWCTLENYVDAGTVSCSEIGWRGDDASGNLKETGTNHWNSPNTGATNSSGFTGIGSGLRATDGTFDAVLEMALFWSSSEAGSNAWGRYLDYSNSQVFRGEDEKNHGFSVRCLWDETVPNQAPSQPTSPSPADVSTDQGVNSTLSWTCSDPESDPLTYDVYFGTDNPPAQVATGQAETTYDPGILEYSTQYFWKIVAHDDQGNSTEGEVWSFNVIATPPPAGEVYNPATGRTWMDRNLGASQVATSSTDEAAYGDLYQWGRATEGHESRTSGQTSTTATTAEPNLGNPWDGLFIYPPGSTPFDWLTSQNNNLWQGASGINNPCPTGFRLPTGAEWQAERTSWSSNNSAGAFDSPLKLVVGGQRDALDGAINYVGTYGSYWSSSVSLDRISTLFFSSSFAGVLTYDRAVGYSVRCIKEETTNQAPSQPSSPSPADASTDQAVNTSLSWSCTDPESDPLTYDVYFGTDNPPAQVATGQSETTYDPGTLQYNTQYFWKIVAHDDQGNSTEGTVWSLTTTEEPTGFSCGDVLIDSRDDQQYETVQIGNMCWMAENLNIGSRIDGSGYQMDNSTIEKYCYDNEDFNCDTYGGLYQWDEMMQYTTIESVQGICPNGWLIPSDDEIKILEGTVDSNYGVGNPVWDGTGNRGSDAGTNLKSTTGWNSGGNGSDLFGYNALPCGWAIPGVAFADIGAYNTLWSSSEAGNVAWSRIISDDNAGISRSSGFYKNNGFGVRCFMDISNGNQVPDPPSILSPTNGAVDQPTEGTTLSWTCTDPDSDPLTYDVYFGTENPPAQVATGQSETTYDPGTLQYSTQYFWKIVAHDDQGNSTEGEVWSFTTVEEPGPFACGEIITDSRDGNTYETVLIGGQCWMAENLAFLPEVSPTSENSGTSPFYYVYDYQGTDVSAAIATTNYQTYGTLYNWPASLTSCPEGWHLSSDEEWKILEGTVDSQYPLGDPVWDDAGWRGFDAGKNLKATSGWDDNGNGVDLYNFSALPGGFCSSGGFGSLGNQGMWWSSTEKTTTDVWGRNLWIGDIKSARYDYDKDRGRAVRCLKSDYVPANQPPEAPANPNPAEGAVDQPTEGTTLSWICTDPESDPLTYDVYFGTDNPPAQVSTGQSETTYDPGTLEYSTEYFWKIVAHDDQGNSTEGPIWSFTTETLEIGDEFEGGIIAYILQAGDPGYIEGETHGIIAAPSDQSIAISWGCQNVTIGTSAELGSSAANTAAIVSGCNTPGIAARVCDELVLNGYDDWVLPSKDALDKLYLSKELIGEFAAPAHWSSTELNYKYAWLQDFSNGVQFSNNKSSTANVRAIRTF